MRPCLHRRGIALLLVLASLAVAVSAAAVLAGVALHARVHAGLVGEERVSDGLLRASEWAIRDWLQRHAGRVVLSPDNTSPRFRVLDDSLDISGRVWRVTITAFDQCGMVSWGARCTDVDSVLPEDVLARFASIDEDARRRPGLDLLHAVRSHGRPTFPTSSGTGFSASGELLATHNPVLEGRAPLLNVNTAPVALLDAVYRANRRAGIDAIIDARATGRVASPGATTGDSEPTGTVPLPVAMSTAWAFRIDCSAGGVRRSWWSIYVDSGSDWERVQRLAIVE